MEAWIKPSTTSGSVIDFASASSDYLNRISIAYNGGAVYAETWIESTRYGACTTTPSAPVPLNAWSHVARVTRWLDAQGKTWQVDLYVNGTLATQSLPCAVSANLLASPDSGIYNNNPLDATRGWAYAFVGRPTNFEGTTASFSGLAGEVAVYSRPLPAARIAAHFAASFALPPSPPPPPPSPPPPSPPPTSALSKLPAGSVVAWCVCITAPLSPGSATALAAAVNARSGATFANACDPDPELFPSGDAMTSTKRLCRRPPSLVWWRCPRAISTRWRCSQTEPCLGGGATPRAKLPCPTPHAAVSSL